MELGDFLRRTKYCDCKSPEIKRLAFDLTKNINNNKEKAVILFYWVRDNILYRVGFWNKKASETLIEKKGGCTSKANLLVALLRAIGIPAGYGLMRVKGREYFGPIVPPFLKTKISKESTHVYAYVYLQGRWIKCDPSDDKELSEKTSYFNPQSKLVGWNGESDAMLNLSQSHILKNEGPLANIDEIIEKKPETATRIVVKMGNFYIQFLRENEQKIVSLVQLESLFKSWLKKKHPLFYCLFLIVSFWQSIKIRLHLIKY
jgi:hypothetical protein